MLLYIFNRRLGVIDKNTRLCQLNNYVSIFNCDDTGNISIDYKIDRFYLEK